MSPQSNLAGEWYIARDKHKLGPYSFEQLRQQARSGDIAPSDLVLPAGSTTWKEAVSIPGLFSPPGTQGAQQIPETVSGSDNNAKANTGLVETITFGPPTGNAAPNLPHIPGYEILERIRKGGMGVVYKARQTKLKRLVALKMILAGAEAGPNLLQRFRIEAEAVARLQHPHIVQIYEVGEHNGQPFFSLEYLEGGNLAQRIAGNPQPPREAAQLIETLARAVHAAHQAGIVHRDLKPANILLTKDGQPKVADFGLAKHIDADQALSHTGDLLGTPPYMAPEQAVGETKTIGPATDVYALGAILYELLTGRPPFMGATKWETLDLVRTQEPVSPRQLQPKVSRDLETICLKCLEKDMAKRYSTAEALADDLHRFSLGDPIKARRIGSIERTWRWCKRRPAAASLVIVSIIVLFASLGAAFWFVEDRANQREEQLIRDAEAKRRKDLAEQTARIEIDQAKAIREELHSSLKNRGGVFELLNRPEKWEAQIRLGRTLVGKAKERVAEHLIDPELKEEISSLENLLRHDDEDRNLALRLERIRLEKADHDEEFPHRRVAQDYYQAFLDAGMTVWKDNNYSLSARLQASPIKEQLVAALEDWALVASFSKERTSGQVAEFDLLVIAKTLAPDPDWSDHLRDPKIRRDAKALARLAEEAPLERLSPQLIVYLGSALKRQRPLQESWLRRGQARYPADFWLNYAFANALIATKKPIEAESHFRFALAIRPACSPAFCGLGLALNQQQRFSEAIAAYETAIKLDPRYWLAYANLGALLTAQNNHPEAVAAFRKAIELRQNWPRAHYLLGQALRKQNKLSEAIASYKKAIELGPKFALAYTGLGSAYYEQKKFADAIEAHSKAVDLDGKLATAYYGLARALHDDGKPNAAIKAYQQVVELEPTFISPRARLGEALQDRTKTSAQLGRAKGDKSLLEAAIADCNHICKLFPKDPNSLVWRAHVRVWKGDVDLAIADCNSALQLNSKLASAYRIRGLAFFKKKELNIAIADLDIAIKLNPADADAFMDRAMVWEKKGERLKAGADREEAFQLDGRAIEAKELLRERNALSSKRATGPEESKMHQNVHPFKMDAGKTYIIDAIPLSDTLEVGSKSVDFDPHVRLELASGKVLKEDGGSVQSSSAPLAFRTSVAGEYRIIVTTLKPSQDGTYLLIVGELPFADHEWQLKRIKRAWQSRQAFELIRHRLHSNAVNRFAVSDDGKHVLSCSPAEKKVLLWDLASGSEIAQFSKEDETYGAAIFGPDPGSVILAGTRKEASKSVGVIRFWDARDTAVHQAFEGTSGRISTIAIDRNGQFVLTGGDEKVLRVWDLHDRKLVRVLKGHAASVNWVTFSDDGTRALSAGRDGTLHLWDMATGKSLRVIEAHKGPAVCVAFSPDGRYALSAGHEDRTIALWNLEDGQIIRRFEGHLGKLSSVAMSPDGRFALSSSMGSYDPNKKDWIKGSDQTLRLWELATGKEIAVMKGHQGSVRHVIFTPDGRNALSASGDRTVRLWRLPLLGKQ